MTLASMTGFARSAGSQGAFNWVWELKSVNGKALDVRLRMANGYDHLEPAARQCLMQGFKRGNIQASLNIASAHVVEKISINNDVLEQYLVVAKQLHQRLGGEAPRADILLSLRGVLEVTPVEIDETEQAKRDVAILNALAEAVKSLSMARREEGARLRETFAAQVAKIEDLTKAASNDPSRSVELIRQRLAEQLARLLEASNAFDFDRLHQEAVMIATRADIQEEIDRLLAHVSAARALLASPEPVGRKLDFLAQEFNREANTLCSKAGSKTMSAIGLELKTVIDQLREQVQNIE